MDELCVHYADGYIGHYDINATSDKDATKSFFWDIECSSIERCGINRCLFIHNQHRISIDLNTAVFDVNGLCFKLSNIEDSGYHRNLVFYRTVVYDGRKNTTITYNIGYKVYQENGESVIKVLKICDI